MTNRAYHVIISVEAANMLNEHVSFLAQVSSSAAHVLYNDLLARINSLGKTPFLHPRFTSDTLSDRYSVEYRKLIYKRYLILYTVETSTKTVFVERIWDTRMDNSL